MYLFVMLKGWVVFGREVMQHFSNLTVIVDYGSIWSHLGGYGGSESWKGLSFNLKVDSKSPLTLFFRLVSF